ncbi:hypothetical protein HK100_003413 [Physocladia obscura]|uniref:Uncharacterized protein n=1 Tax=Physocladia obscura TaxID=109957 RepID=A0AAD5XFZ6_9FUNG|nr:hypothetical protein HK100_003413 [Physocladia obscura]
MSPLLPDSNPIVATVLENLARRWDECDVEDGDSPESCFSESGKLFRGIVGKEKTGEGGGGEYTYNIFDAVRKSIHDLKSINCKCIADKSETSSQNRNAVENNLFVHLALQNSSSQLTLNPFIATSPSSFSTTATPAFLDAAALSTPKGSKTPAPRKQYARLTPATLRKDRLGNKVRTLGVAVDNLRQTKAAMDLINLPLAAATTESQQRSLTKKQPKTPKDGGGVAGGGNAKQVTPNGKRRGRKSKSQLETERAEEVGGATNGLSSSPAAAASGISAMASSPVVTRYPRTGMPMPYFITGGIGGGRVATAVAGSPLSSFHYLQSPVLTRAGTSNLSAFLADVDRMNGEDDGDASDVGGGSGNGIVDSRIQHSATTAAEEDPFVAAACALMLINNNGAASPMTPPPPQSPLSLNAPVSQISAIQPETLSRKRKISTSINPTQFQEYLLREKASDDNSDRLAAASSSSSLPPLSSKQQRTRKILFGTKSKSDVGILEGSTSLLSNFLYSPVISDDGVAAAVTAGAGSGLSIFNSVSTSISAGTVAATMTTAVAPASLMSEETAAAATAVYSLHSKATITTPTKKRRELLPRTHSALQLGGNRSRSNSDFWEMPLPQLSLTSNSCSTALAASVPSQIEQKIVVAPQSRENKTAAAAIATTKAVTKNPTTTYVDSKLSIIVSSPQQKAFDSSSSISSISMSSSSDSSSDCIPTVAGNNWSEIKISDAVNTDDEDYFNDCLADDDGSNKGGMDSSNRWEEGCRIMRKQDESSMCGDSKDLDDFTTGATAVDTVAVGDCGDDGEATAAVIVEQDFKMGGVDSEENDSEDDETKASQLLCEIRKRGNGYSAGY